ncbi:MAG TPA: polysaccharide biosynthesis/export family protein, partial [Pyrinomonadaceae bacterium]|nr:polysaccharide biosynthesis/export family protein [Pyrinomonadaceae bacterium]
MAKTAWVIALLMFGLSHQASAQQAAVTPASQVQASAVVTASVKASDTKYRIGPGDMLDIRVFNRPQFSRDSVRVDSGGMIRMPLIEGEIRAACLT